MAASETTDLFELRRRPPQEKLVDQGFRQLAIALASIVGLVLLGILLTVLSGSREAMAQFGLRFLVISDWDPAGDTYGAFTAIYGTIVTSILALVIAVPLGVGTAIFITENLIPLRLRQVLGIMVELLAAIRALDRAGTPINYVTVAAVAGVSRALLYRDPDLSHEIQRLRRTGPSAQPRQPAAQRATAKSQIQLLDNSRAEVSALRRENDQLRQRLAETLGEQRAAGHQPPAPA